MKYYIGVDPGKPPRGGLALVKEGLAVEYEPMPGTVKGIKSWLEFVNYRAFSEKDQVVMVIEKAQVFPGNGAVGMFNYGKHYGAFEALAVALDIPYHEVNQGVWKKAMGLTKEKALSIVLCERLFPTVNLLFPRCTKKSDHVAEAILLAEYGRRLNL